MFWKLVNFRRIKSWSLVTKLMILYSLSTIGILGAVFIFLYPSFVKLVNQSHNPITASYSAATVSPMSFSSLHLSNDISIECLQKTIIALLLSAVGAIFLGNVIARNGLRRITEFTTLMEKITSKDLNARVDPNDWPKELKILGSTFNTMLNRIETSFIQLSQFSSDIAHELRNPINNLRGMTEVALSKDKNIQNINQILESHLEEYEYLSRLIDNLFFLARSDCGQNVIAKETIHIDNEILKICEFYQALADENKITIICQGANEVIAGDTILFRRVINNLVSNAIRHTPCGGQILVKVDPLSNNFIKISVIDTGVGIAAEHLPRIFDRFYRVDFSRSSHSGGLGLGLAIVKSIMDLHKGSISVESTLNQGASFHLVFQRI